MSVHPSLSSKGIGKGKRSVLKRFERIKDMLEKEKWKPGDSVFGLFKLKAVRWKAKKTKKAADVEAAGAEGATAGEAAASGKKDPAGKK